MRHGHLAFLSHLPAFASIFLFGGRARVGLWALWGAVTLVHCGAPAEPPKGAQAGVDAEGKVAGSAAAGERRRRPMEDESRGVEPGLGGGESALEVEVMRGEAALEAGRFEVARQHFLNALGLEPTHSRAALGAISAMRLSGQADARQQMVTRVQHEIDLLLDEDAHSGPAWLLRAQLAMALGEPMQAMDAAHMAVHTMPELPLAWQTLGEAALLEEQWREAFSAFRQALAYAGEEADDGEIAYLWEKIADAQDELGWMGAAEAAARRALEPAGLSPELRVRRLNLLAVIYKHQGKLGEADEALDEALALDADHPITLHNIGALHEAQGEYEAAMAVYERLLVETPSPMTLWRLGHLHLLQESPEAALGHFKRAAGLIDRWGWPLSERWRPAFDVAKLYARQELWAEARGWFEDALRLARDIDTIQEIQSWLHLIPYP